ncbi:MAG: sugar ABC transporter substrate-binding protein [Bacillota bacterium]
MFRRSMAAVLVVILALSITLTGCSLKRGPVTISFWVLDSFTKGTDTPLSKAITQFEADNPNIKVDLQPMAANAIHDKLVTAISGGGGPDVFNTDIAWMGEFIGMGLFQDITKQAEPSKADFFDGPMSAVTKDGKIYALPWYTNNLGLYYNKDMFAAAGIQAPPTTWDEFYTDAQKLKAKGYDALSLGRGGFGIYSFLSFLFENGASVFGPDGKTLTVNSPEAVEAFDWFTGLYTKLHAVPESVKSAFSWDQVYAPFIQKQAAMVISGDWAKWSLSSNKDLHWDVAPLPKGKSHATVAGGYNLAIGKNSKNQAADWKLINFLTEKQNEWILEGYGRIPARKDITDSDYAKKDPFIGTFIQQAQYGVPQPAIAVWPKISDMMGDAFDSVIQGKKTPQQALDDVVKQGQPIVDSAGK